MSGNRNKDWPGYPINDEKLDRWFDRAVELMRARLSEKDAQGFTGWDDMADDDAINGLRVRAVTNTLTDDHIDAANLNLILFYYFEVGDIESRRKALCRACRGEVPDVAVEPTHAAGKTWQHLKDGSTEGIYCEASEILGGGA